MVALSYGELESHLETISNIKPFINKHNWKKKFSSKNTCLENVSEK